MGIELSLHCTQRKTREKLLSSRFEKEKPELSDESALYEKKWLEELENAFLRQECSTSQSEKAKMLDPSEPYLTSSPNLSNMESFLNEANQSKLFSFDQKSVVAILNSKSSSEKLLPAAITPNPWEPTECLVLYQEKKSVQTWACAPSRIREVRVALDSISAHKSYSNLSQALRQVGQKETLLGFYQTSEEFPSVCLLLRDQDPGSPTGGQLETETIENLDDHFQLEKILNERARQSFQLTTMVDLASETKGKELGSNSFHVLIFEKLKEVPRSTFIVTTCDQALLTKSANPLVEISRRIDIFCESDDLLFSAIITDTKRKQLILVFSKGNS